MEVIARLAADESLGDRVTKVNHAGEHGAVNIYRAQLLACRWRNSDITSELREFLDHEMRHRGIFAAELIRRGRSRCRSYHLCGLGGFALGLVTGLCGRASIAATTVAVETVVLRHLEAQMSTLRLVDLRNADLGRDNLGGSTSLQGANLADAILNRAKLSGAKYDDRTIFPRGFAPHAAGMIEEVADREA